MSLMIKHSVGIVYFLAMEMPGSPIKIGFTKISVRRRIVHLQQISPFRILWLGSFNGTYMDERGAHRLLDEHRIRGEWFRPAPEVLAFICEKTPGFVPMFADEIARAKPRKGQSELRKELGFAGFASCHNGGRMTSPHHTIGQDQTGHADQEQPEQRALKGHLTNITVTARFGSTPIDKQAGPAIKGAI